ncbi:Transient receptor potential cation channel [Oopsacas minuta]|uniref:Transient receptor potential cation channel n=1 Tax=Oopsacas minuta TaxID=111878 RepID=A0AAV7JPP7_9METZ|nr:Transient receptor potential cation channel [Oopsacas minuta]
MASIEDGIPVYSELDTTGSAEGLELFPLKGKQDSISEANRPITHGMRSSDHISLRNELLQAARDGMDEKFSELLEFICTSKQMKWTRSSISTVEKIGFYDIDHLLNSFDNKQHTILHYAARYNRFNILTALLKNGGKYNVDLNVETDIGYTPLHYAARYISVEQENLDIEKLSEEEIQSFSQDSNKCSVASLRFLIEFGGDKLLNKTDSFEQTALHHACVRGNYFGVIELLKQGISTNAIDCQWSTALYFACERRYSNIVSLLVEKCDIFSCNMHGLTPFHLAAFVGSEKIFSILYTKFISIDPNNLHLLTVCNDVKGNSILHSACLGGNEKCVTLCIEIGITLDSENTDGAKPIHLAAQQGKVSIAALLLETDPECISAIDRTQNTPLHYAARNCRYSMIEFLLNTGACINTKNLNSYSPLMLAVYYGSAMGVMEILKHTNCQVELRDRLGRNALSIAIEKNEKLVVTEILNHRRGRWLVNEKDDEDKTPLHVVAKHGYVEILDLLLDTKNCDVVALNSFKETPLHVAAFSGKATIVQRLLDYLEEVSIEMLGDEDMYGNTALHLACEQGQLEVVELLMKARANINAINFNNRSPLHLAAAAGHVQVAEYLIQEEAPIDSDVTASTPLLLACQAGHLLMVKLLLKHGADICKHEDRAEIGNNALDLAIDAGNEEVVEILIQHHDIRKALKNYTFIHGKVLTPLRKMIPKMPTQAYKVMSLYINCNFNQFDSPENPAVAVEFNFELLDDVEAFQTFYLHNEDKYKLKKPLASHLYDASRLKKKSHPFSFMVQHSRIDLLNHPLVLTMMRLKWSTRASYLYYGNLISYFTFVFLLTIFTYVVPSCDLRFDHELGFDNNRNSNYCGSDPGASNWYVDTYGCSSTRCNEGRVISSIVMAAFIIMFAFFRLLFESLQIFGDIKGYFLSIENYLEWFIYVGSIVYVSDVFKIRQEVGACGFENSLIWELGAFVVLLSWFNLVVFLGKLPHLGIYILMFLHVIETFFRVILLALAFLIGFSVSFYMVFRQQNFCSQYRNPFSTLLKTTVMLTGEFEYDNIFNDITRRLDHPISSYILFLVFIVFVSIILANLLVGLAVDDIKGVQESATLKRIVLKIDLLLFFEETFPFSIYSLRKRSALKTVKLYPNQKSIISRILITFGFKALIKMKDVLKALETKQTNVKINTPNWKQKLENDNLQIRRSLRRIEIREHRIEKREQELEIREQNIEKMLTQLTNKLIPAQAEDIQSD